MNGKTALIIVVVVSILVWTVAVPLVIYAAIKFWRNRGAHYIAKRRPVLVIFLIVVMLFDAAIIRPLSALLEIVCIIPSYNDNSNNYSWLQSNHISIALAWYISLVPLLGNIRLFSLIYDWKKSKELLSLRWKSQITSTQYHETSLLHILYHKLFGNYKLLILIILIWFVITDIIIISTTSNPSIQLVFGTVFIIFDVGPCVILLILALFLKDAIGLRKEIIKLITLCFVCLTSWLVINLFIPYDIYTYQRSVSKVFIFIPCVITASLIMAKPDSDNITCKNSKRLRFLSNAVSSMRSYSHTSDHRRESQPQINPLYNVLNDKHGIDYFADYLVKEFSIENLLFIIELKHLQIELTRNNVINQIKMDDIWNLDISDEIMQLFTKAKYNNIEQCFKYVIIIFNQYISSNGMSQINISSKTRVEIKNIIESTNQMEIIDYNKILIELYKKCQDAGKQIFHLLSTDSFSRFKKTPEYINWKHLTFTAVQINNGGATVTI